MLPENFKVTVPEKKQYELLPDDSYQVAITKIEFRENQPVYQSPNEFEDRLNFEFTITEEGQYKGRKLWKEVSTVMTAGSNGYSASGLYKIFSAVNRVSLSDDEAKSVGGSDIDAMLGKELRLVVKIEPNRKGEKKNKIKDMLPLKLGSTVPSPEVEMANDNPDVEMGDLPDPNDIPF